MNKGIFWLITNQSGEKELLCIKVACDAMGDPKEQVMFSSKSGENFNHKAEWSKLSPRLTLGKPFNYFPRGRVEIRKGKVTVFCHPELIQPPYRNWIIRDFEIPESSRFVADGSAHYQADTM